MSTQDVVALVGALGGFGGAWALVDGILRRRKMSVEQGQIVTGTAVKLVEALETRAKTLETQLEHANLRADDLDTKLRGANEQVDGLRRSHDEMSERLADAQAEVRVLRGQVKMLTEELDRRQT
jgi:chromosome segregation ATPase